MVVLKKIEIKSLSTQVSTQAKSGYLTSQKVTLEKELVPSKQNMKSKEMLMLSLKRICKRPIKRVPIKFLKVYWTTGQDTGLQLPMHASGSLAVQPIMFKHKEKKLRTLIVQQMKMMRLFSLDKFRIPTKHYGMKDLSKLEISKNTNI